jgi:hypothetical protein
VTRCGDARARNEVHQRHEDQQHRKAPVPAEVEVVAGEQQHVLAQPGMPRETMIEKDHRGQEHEEMQRLE